MVRLLLFCRLSKETPRKVVHMGALLKTISLIFIFAINGINSQYPDDGVEDLVSESDFRSLKLRWRYSNVGGGDPFGFTVTFCEMKTDCFDRHLLLGKRQVLTGHDSISTDGSGHFEAILYGLRMLTNYSVAVQALSNENHLPPNVAEGRQGIFAPHTILVRTKGFSAHARNCQSNSSDIVVHSGPYFGGLIAVEGTTDERCRLYGDRSSSQDTYTLKIDHQVCNSKIVNETRIDTVVVVHESSSVVTHNSRKFLVQCTFMPSTFTIKAAFNVPQDNSLDKKNFNYRQLEEALKNADSNDIYTYDHYKQNNVKDSRMSSEQAQSVLHGSVPGYESQMLSLLVVVIILIIVIVVVIGFTLWCYIHSHRRRSDSADIETLSTSGSSFLAYHIGDHDSLMHPAHCPTTSSPLNDAVYSQTFPRTVNPFLGNQVALVSLKPVKELY